MHQYSPDTELAVAEPVVSELVVAEPVVSELVVSELAELSNCRSIELPKYRSSNQAMHNEQRKLV